MNAVYFIEKEGVKHYKCDTFWSRSTDITDAKIHDDSRVGDFLNSLINGYLKDGGSELDGSIYGYQTFEESQLENRFFLKPNPEILQTYYVNIIRVKNGRFEIEDYRNVVRGQKIDNILNSHNK